MGRKKVRLCEARLLSKAKGGRTTASEKNRERSENVRSEERGGKRGRVKRKN